MRIVPPIKSQGIKTKLVDWIGAHAAQIQYQRWVEPFMGTGAVGFNMRPRQALMCDSNPHLIRFYLSLQKQEITPAIVREFLTEEGKKLLASEGAHFYEVRSRFNAKGNPLDFLFLSRSCFNGMMRFNRKGEFNVPFCKKPKRFAPALVTKITNQVARVSEVIAAGDFTFRHQPFQETLASISENDLVYCDPPYIGRHVDYFDSWSEEEEKVLQQLLASSGASYLLSTWLKNKYRINDFVFSIWKEAQLSTKAHFYHVGGREINRNAVCEALLSNVRLPQSQAVEEMQALLAHDASALLE